VQLSRDDGQTWQMVALDVSTTTINLDTSLLGASQLARLRLLASDGVNTAEAISPRFILAPRSPVVVIFSPEDGSTFAPGQSIELSGSAWDPEDGLLPGAELAWFVDGNALGTGENMTLPPLTAGVHTITLQAQDSDGNLITRQVTVNLAYRLFLTAMFR
jgi:hypothetical protein